eukprot:TRINITY_DN14648_c0_g2_i1.p1 TRINITY_DN14648_c0_g2~~TRINITY_DN14648_c0_g2_i1.p1  ORF type:complete len:132 (+),score=0.28 TRINITY_DN14648_c0_g2_i1:39-434(+)
MLLVGDAAGEHRGRKSFPLHWLMKNRQCGLWVCRFIIELMSIAYLGTYLWWVMMEGCRDRRKDKVFTKMGCSFACMVDEVTSSSTSHDLYHQFIVKAAYMIYTPVKGLLLNSRLSICPVNSMYRLYLVFSI